MHFRIKNILKNNFNHILKHALTTCKIIKEAKYKPLTLKNRLIEAKYTFMHLRYIKCQQNLLILMNEQKFNRVMQQ